MTLPKHQAVELHERLEQLRLPTTFEELEKMLPLPEGPIAPILWSDSIATNQARERALREP